MLLLSAYCVCQWIDQSLGQITDYLDVIKDPIDLTMIEKRLNQPNTFYKTKVGSRLWTPSPLSTYSWQIHLFVARCVRSAGDFPCRSQTNGRQLSGLQQSRYGTSPAEFALPFAARRNPCAVHGSALLVTFNSLCGLCLQVWYDCANILEQFFTSRLEALPTF